MKKNSTDSFSITVSSIPNLRLAFLAFSLAFLPLPVIASPKIMVSPRHFTDGDTVNVKITVVDDDNIPIEGLKPSDFKIQTAQIVGEKKDNLPNLRYSRVNRLKLISPGDKLTSDPVYVVILLDMSGSMRVKDFSGVRKIDGAVRAIQGFIQLVREKNLRASISVVPFGESSNPKDNYVVNQQIISENLLPASSEKLDERVADLASSPINAGTNLYDPLKEAVQYLGKNSQELITEANNNLSSNDGQELILPKLAVILLSDGYHNSNRSTENQQFAELTQTLQKYPTVRVYTLGYGESLKQLKERARNCNISYSLLDKKEAVDLIQSCKLPEDDIYNYIVDQPRLKQIAEITGGISKFPGSADEALISLRTFFNALREYEVQFKPVSSKPGEEYRVKVSIDSYNRKIRNLNAKPFNIRMPSISFYKLPLIPDRLIILILTVVIFGCTLWSFKIWTDQLKREAERWI